MASFDTSGSLADFLRVHREALIGSWLRAVRACAPSRNLPEPALVDHLPFLLTRIADAIELDPAEQSEAPTEPAIVHAMGRLAHGFDVRDVVTELFLLRQVALDFLAAHRPGPTSVNDAQVLSCAIDSAVRESVGAFSAAKQRTLLALDRISAEALSCHRLDELLPRLLRAMLETAPDVDVACLLLVDGNRLKHRAAAGLDPGHQRASVALGQGLAGRAAAERTPIAGSTDDADDEENASLRELGVRALYAVPLLEDDTLLGIVQVGSSSVESFSPLRTPLLRAAAERIAAALYQAGLRERAERAEREIRAALHDADLERQRLSAAEEALRERERRFRALIENLSSGVALVDGSGRFTLHNSRFLEVFGLEPREIEGVTYTDWSAWEVFDAEGRRLELDEYPVRKAVSTGEAVRNRLIGVRKPHGGDLVWLLVSAEPLRAADGTLEQTICTLHDVTEQKLLEQELRDADRRKNEFLGVLSHELRNPLSPIKSSLYILERAPPGGEQARRAQAVIDRQVNHLARLVDDLLDVTRITRGKIRLLITRVDLLDVVRRTLEDRRSELEQHELELSLPERAIWIEGDPTRLAQITGNLLQNAAKFTPGGGKISVSVRADPERAVLEVADDGIGLDAETLRTLFEPFAQADRSLGRSNGGLGLGLALVRGLVELHGGEVQAESDGPGRGARFTITLPVAEDAGAKRLDVAQQGEGLARRRVLVIEDGKDAADSLSEALALAGHRVVVAENGESALEKAREFHPEVVVCDIGLPDTDGYAVAAALRREPATAGATLVALTGYARPEDQRRAIDAGFDTHLAKPPDMAALDRLLARSGLHG